MNWASSSTTKGRSSSELAPEDTRAAHSASGLSRSRSKVLPKASGESASARNRRSRYARHSCPSRRRMEAIVWDLPLCCLTSLRFCCVTKMTTASVAREPLWGCGLRCAPVHLYPDCIPQTFWSRSVARAAVCVPPATHAAWSRPPPISSITSCRRCPCASGCRELREHRGRSGVGVTRWGECVLSNTHQAPEIKRAHTPSPNTIHEPSPQRGTVDFLTPQIDLGDQSRVGDIVQRIRVEHHEVGALFRCHRP